MKTLTLFLSFLACSGNCLAEESISLDEFERLDGAEYTHRIKALTFAEMDGVQPVELVALETGHEFPIGYIATISRIEDGARKLLWKSKNLWGADEMIVGDIDGDERDELVFIGPRFENYTEIEKTLRLIQQDGQDFTDVGYTISGNLGSVIDIDDDNRQEILLVKTREKLGDAAGLHPVDLILYSYVGREFRSISEYSLDHAVNFLSVGDLNGDGIEEIVTLENSVDGAVRSQIGVYQYDSTSRKLKIVASKNRAFESSTYIVTDFLIADLEGKQYVVIRLVGGETILFHLEDQMLVEAKLDDTGLEKLPGKGSIQTDQYVGEVDFPGKVLTLHPR